MANIDVVKAKVQRILVEELELTVMLRPGSLEARFESTSVQVIVAETGEGDAARIFITIFSPMLVAVPESPEVYKWIATEGGSYNFGHASWRPDDEEPGKGTILFSHVLLGDYLDNAELSTAFMFLTSTVENLDDELKAKFGGLRWVDLE